jgi:chromosome segregation ATPase
MASLTLSLAEFIFLMLCGVIVGIVVYYIIASRRSFRETVAGQTSKSSKELESWKSKYFNDIEFRDKQVEQLRDKLADIEENSQINLIEAEELRKQNKKVLAEIENLKKAAAAPSSNIQPGNNNEAGELLQRITALESKNRDQYHETERLRRENERLKEELELQRSLELSPGADKSGYIEQLTRAQANLLEHNRKISELLGQIDIVKATEEKQQETLAHNEALAMQVEELQHQLIEKEKQVNNIQEKAHLTKEMTSMLDNAYSEFNTLQDKIHKLETQVAASKKISIEYEDIREDYYKVTRELDEIRIRHDALQVEKAELTRELSESEDKLREASFQRQQLQKRVAYLEELNNDIQSVADTNKKLEGQLKRLGELESMLNVVAEERDELAKKQKNA